MAHLTAIERQTYAEFVWTFADECWACAVSPLPVLTAIVFNPTETHHIVGGAGRRHDRRCLARLCKVHHMLAHGETIRRCDGTPLRRLTLGNILWLKSRFDAEHYDPAYLQSLRIADHDELTVETME